VDVIRDHGPGGSQSECNVLLELEQRVKPEPRLQELDARRRWFEEYCMVLESGSVHADPIPGASYRCPCCGAKTLDERGGFEICSVCLWEDDGQDDHDADVARGGPNGELSLAVARANYERFGACKRSALPHVRAALPEEL
jgi:hypothetical protein